MSNVKTEKIEVQVRRNEEIQQINEELFKTKQALAESAKEVFNLRKDALLETMKQKNVPKEWINGLYQASDPTLLEKYESMTDNYRQYEERNDPSNPPKGSVINYNNTYGDKKMRKGYDNYRDMIDDLYDRQSKGDESATYDLEKLWQKASKVIATGRDSRGMPTPPVSVSGCPRCKTAVVPGQDTCVKCGYNFSKFTSKGGELN